jgi:cytosine/adenosine deaminase-related metal-dependent hydrolase
MGRQLILAQEIVTLDAERRVLRGGGVLVADAVIEQVLSREEVAVLKEFDGEIVNADRLTAVPGFVQTHVHLCQSLFRGLADDLELLDWLRLKIFPFEAAHSSSSMYASGLLGLSELIRSGTTTIMDMGSINCEEEIVRAIDETGIRAFVGKSMIDINEIYPPFREQTRDAIDTSARQAERWHGRFEGRIRYAVAPRFVLSCTDDLLKEAYSLTALFPGMLFHTHAAESSREMEVVRARCGKDNIEHFESLGILHPNTCLAHCIWVNPTEVDLLRARQAKVLHCPSSNLKLGSGVARIPEFLDRGISVSIGADGAPCNNTLDAFREMRLAALIQKPAHGPAALGARTVLEMATLGGAAALGLSDEIGSIEPGKKADITFLDLNRVWNPYHGGLYDGICSAIVYSGTPENVHSVLVNGEWLYREGNHVRVDERRVHERAGAELNDLLNRVQS